jgi:DNA-binding LacI/PurR family transcriptional regulator
VAGKAPTLAAVARAAGVSIATASRALTHSPNVSPEAYQRVCAAAYDLGYRRHRARFGRSVERIGAVAMLIHAPYERIYGDPFYPRLIGAAEAELAERDVPLLVTGVTAANLTGLGRLLGRGGLDAVIIVADHGPFPLSTSVATRGLPVAVVGRPLRPCHVPYVDADNVGGARAAVEHLVATGRRAIGHVAGPPDTAGGADRLAGYRAALRDAGLAHLPVAYGDWGQTAAAHAMGRLLDQRPRLDAVFVASDAMAAGALRMLRRAGRRVPDDVALVGFDDDAIARAVRPALTTVRQPVEQFGTIAVRSLLGTLRGDPAATVLPTTLIRRQSA